MSGVMDLVATKVSPEPNTGCWLWTGSVRGKGYGCAYNPRTQKLVNAHRYVYELAHGSVSHDLVVCHRCDTPACVNPDHMFVGTASDNARDMVAKGRQWNMRKDRCANGHPFTPENTYIRPGSINSRDCRTCRRIWGANQRRRRQRRRGPVA